MQRLRLFTCSTCGGQTRDLESTAFCPLWFQECSKQFLSMDTGRILQGRARKSIPKSPDVPQLRHHVAPKHFAAWKQSNGSG